MQWKSEKRVALTALLGGAAGIGFAPIFVRLSEVGPSATAFYRVLFALPVLWLVAALESRSARVRTDSASSLAGDGAVGGSGKLGRWPWRRASPLWFCAVAGALFAADLAFWHWSIKLTSVANSTLLTNCAPFFVMLGARVLFGERLTALLMLGMIVAAVGAAMLVGVSLHLTARHLLGDGLALVTAIFYGGYLLTVKYLRSWLTTASILAWSGLVSCGFLLLFALLAHEPIRIVSSHGWRILLGLALVSHLGGQGLIAFALAHLPAGFSSVGLLLQPVVAAVLAWWLLSESLSLTQIFGGAVVLVGIALASRSPR